ncbi:MAG TPA: DegQ family serine endoprotease [Arenibaculum sp.]|nr:DegQ family serine endoprotease [Arenibaculum sp.]
MKQSPFSRRLRHGTAIVLCAGVLAATGAGAGAGFAAVDEPAKAPLNADAPTVSGELVQQAGYADLVEHVMPAVVNVSTARTREAAPRGDFPSGTPFDEFFRQFRDQLPEQFRDQFPNQGPDQDRRGRGMPPSGQATALGSGFVVDPSGYVVTNNHVIDGADEIAITLQDGTRLDAELVGTDPKTDIALLKVEPEEPLPYVEFGDSDVARVGDVVVAIGNPFGLGGSVTTGIVSARSRDIHAGPYDDFLQIDAAINRGNSGGPTFDTQGRVIGINTAIFSPSGGSVGIGFAIPANLAKSVVAQLREDGAVTRGWIGVQIQPVTPDIAEGLGNPDLQGALVADVVDDGPAAEAGLEPGDVIVAVAGQPVEDLRDVTRGIADVEPGKSVSLDVFRGGSTEARNLVVAGMPDEPQVADAGPAVEGETGALGLDLAALDHDMRRRLGLSEDVTGVVVVAARDGANAARVRPGDVITAVGNQPVTQPSEVAAKVDEAKSAGRNALLVRVNRQGTEQFVALEIARA